MATVNPYITFNGDCERAFNLYKSIFGGEFTQLERYKDVPKSMSDKFTMCEGEKILHVALPISNETILMGSDTCHETDSEFDSDVHFGDNVSLSINTQSEEEATRIFEGLAKDGRVNMPLQKTFWNAYYGMLIDKYGVNWMISYNYPKQ